MRRLKWCKNCQTTDSFAKCKNIQCIAVRLSYLLYRNKLLFVHNVAAYNPSYELDEHEDMWEIEMPIDADLFEGDVQEIKIGDFVSFRYSGNFASALTPINPKISNHIYSP